MLIRLLTKCKTSVFQSSLIFFDRPFEVSFNFVDIIDQSWFVNRPMTLSLNHVVTCLCRCWCLPVSQAQSQPFIVKSVCIHTTSNNFFCGLVLLEILSWLNWNKDFFDKQHWVASSIDFNTFVSDLKMKSWLALLDVGLLLFDASYGATCSRPLAWA